MTHRLYCRFHVSSAHYMSFNLALLLFVFSFSCSSSLQEDNNNNRTHFPEPPAATPQSTLGYQRRVASLAWPVRLRVTTPLSKVT